MLRTETDNINWFGVSKGVRQGCILSPDLFGLYGEQTMRDAEIDDIDMGVKIGGRLINNLRYADDTTLAATNKNDLEQLLGKVQKSRSSI